MSKDSKAPKTLDGFLSIHDPSVVIPNKIKVALEAMLKKGPEEWEYEDDFLRIADVSKAHIPDYREQFKAHIAVAKNVGGPKRAAKNVWFASPRIAASARGEKK